MVAQVGQCVDAVEYRVPFGSVVGLAFDRGLALHRWMPGAPQCRCGCAAFAFTRH